MSPRRHRQRLILRLVKEHRVASQDELGALLAQEGINCTQATLSRDLRDLHVSRQNTPLGPVYQADNGGAYREALGRVVGMEILGVQHNGCLVVIKTLAGRAAGVAGFLDHLKHPDILGTVAGDDTVFVAPRDPSAIDSLASAIHELEIRSHGT